jgi:succinate dehydrogenase / fumarate reductase cytochrome b subunit
MIGSPAAGPLPIRSFQQTSRARSLLAFTGIAPLGAFVVVHLVTTAAALSGPARFERVFAASPALSAVTFLVVVAPLLFHAGYGAWIALARPQSIEVPTWRPRARRVASLIVLAFVVGHLLELAVPRWTGALPAASLLDALTSHLSSTTSGVPFVAVGYLFGLAATLFHFGTSLWTFLTTWGLVTIRRRPLGWGLGVGGLVLFFLGMNTIVYLATGNRLVGPEPPAFVPDGPPPAPCAPQP